MEHSKLVFVLFFGLVVATFTDVTNQAGVNYHQQVFPYNSDASWCIFPACSLEGMTGGAAVADYNNDGYPVQ